MTAERLDQLYQHCADLGVEVEWEDLGETRRGAYLDDHRCIVLNRRLTLAQTISTLAHEIAHAVFGDRCSSPAAEQRAWEYAAAFLVSPDAYRAAEELVGHHPAALAAELGVTVRVVNSWRAWWHKRGHKTVGGSA